MYRGKPEGGREELGGGFLCIDLKIVTGKQ